MTITNLTISNIRGFQNQIIEATIRPNTTNIVVAPNGYGKSSISTAFRCASGNRLEVADQDKHRNAVNLASSLSLTVDDSVLTADHIKNEISQRFVLHVIKSDIVPKAKVPRINGIVVPKPYLQIPEIDLGPAAQNVQLIYNYTNEKAKFFPNIKVAPNIASLLAAPAIREAMLQALDSIDKLRAVTQASLIQEIMTAAKAATGTRAAILASVRADFEVKVAANGPISAVTNLLIRTAALDWTVALLSTAEIAEVAGRDRANFKKWLQRGEFESRLQRARDFIEDVNSAWVSAEIKEARDRVSVIFPTAGQLSNGQRDLLYLAGQFLKVVNTNTSKGSILIVDEVFDYLDDANLTVAQYFLSNMINNVKAAGGSIYVILLTHLDPAVFRGFALKKINTIYLGIPTPAITNTMKVIINKRDETDWKEELAKYFLHYHPTDTDIIAVFNGTYGLPKAHGKSHSFYAFLTEHWNKLVQGRDDFDPFAVCAHIRIQIEKKAYALLTSDEQRQFFLETHGTRDKLDVAISYGHTCPEIWTLLGLLYNDALHQKGALEQTSTIALKLRNLGLQRMMKKALAH